MSAAACTVCECVWCCVCVWWSLCGMLLSINGPDCNAMCSLCVCVLVHVCVRVCGFSMNLYFIKISSASFNEWLFPLCAVELLKFLGFTVASFAWCARHALLGYVSLLVPKLQRMEKKAQQSNGKDLCSLLSAAAAAAAFAYEFQQLQQFSVTFVIFLPLFSGARERLLETFRPVDCTPNTQHTKHITHSYSHSHSNSERGCGCGCISWLAFELWLSSAVTWLMRVSAINICYVCIARKTFATEICQRPGKLCTWLDFEPPPLPRPHLTSTCECSIPRTNVLQIDSTCISN